MKISEAINFCMQYQKVNSKINTIKNYEFVLGKFENAFNGRDMESIKTGEDIRDVLQIISFALQVILI